MAILFLAIAIAGAALGGVELVNTMLYAESAPQRAAGAALGVAYAVVPYCLARAVQELLREAKSGAKKEAQT